MRFATVQKDDRTFVGLVNEDFSRVTDLAGAGKQLIESISFPNTLLECIQAGDSFLEKVSQFEEKQLPEYTYDLSEVKLLAPIPRPSKNIFCVGKNYAEHAIEMGSAEDIPEHVMMFTKAPTTVVGHGDTVLHHQEITDQLDYEGELAVVIGKKGRAISEEDALDYVFGYTIINDITARDIQSRHKQFFLGKSLDTTCPMGPCIVHKSLIENPNNLHIQTTINGEIRQNANTEQFIFPIETIISVISKGMTLEPGDIITTGSPAGVGKGFKPPRFLKRGDIMEISIEGLGTLRNQIEQ